MNKHRNKYILLILKLQKVQCKTIKSLFKKEKEKRKYVHYISKDIHFLPQKCITLIKKWELRLSISNNCGSINFL